MGWFILTILVVYLFACDKEVKEVKIINYQIREGILKLSIRAWAIRCKNAANQRSISKIVIVVFLVKFLIVKGKM